MWSSSSALRNWPVGLAASLAVALIAMPAAAQRAPRVTVAPGDAPVEYRDVAGGVACRTSASNVVCANANGHRLWCGASNCRVETGSTNGAWDDLSRGSTERPVHPFTEVWAGAWGGTGCIAHEAGGFRCQSASGAAGQISGLTAYRETP